MSEQRIVFICINDVNIQYKFPTMFSIADVISSIASDQKFKKAMIEAFEDADKPLPKLPLAGKIKLRHNTKEGSYCNTNLCLNQYNPDKRVRFYVFQDQGSKYDQKPKGQLFTPQDIEIVNIKLQGSKGSQISQSSQGKSISIDLRKEGKFQTIRDVVQHLRLVFGLNNQRTWFLFSTQRDQKIHAHLKPHDKFKQWVKLNNYKEINAMPVYESG